MIVSESSNASALSQRRNGADPMPQIVFVRHAAPTISDDQPPADWPLSATGRESALALSTSLNRRFAGRRVAVVASAETKAIETAELLGQGEVRVEPRFGEVTKPWYEASTDHHHAASRYLRGEDLAGWEHRHEAIARFESALQDVQEFDADVALVATHGTVLSLWAGRHIEGLDPVAFWLGLKMPDVRVLGIEPTGLALRPMQPADQV